MRPSDHPGNPALALLTGLSERHDRSRAGGRMPSVKVNWGDAVSGVVDVAERILEHAEGRGAVTIDRPRGARHLIERVRLRDAGLLAGLLERTPASEKANAALDEVAPLLAGGAEWVQDALGVGLERWNRGQRAFRLDGADIDGIVAFTRILLAIDEGVDGRDPRTFCLSAGVDSKALERHRGGVVEVVRRAYGVKGPADEVLAAIGFRPFHHPVHLRGPLAVPAMGLDCSAVRPFIALPSAAAGLIVPMAPIAAVLTIENYASFNRHVAEVEQDGVVVVYGGGFASPAVVAALRALASAAPDATFHHWGDIDAGGVRILANLEERVGRWFRPHLMDASLAEARGVPRPPMPALRRIADAGGGAAGLARYLGEGSPRHLEQESTAPSAIPLGEGCD